ncbi:HAD-IA family hydrolase [Magnetospira sp. QH-2]|uniref:HAD-IA family hydrolase n=1 Tax=Magnetospira sp. (strain QH-2) TaxID=1288970 RepID=UPI0003E80AD1|nr:HAD-IA family hydrolase [Magnetospira sp. QH-2]CCQ75077.1 putative haloacid dehalogenase-like hydrolase(CbbY-like) [Magnetospira sp. QH-2]
MTEFSALLFDVDGTLAESEELHRIAFNETFATFGLDWDWDPTLYKKLLKVGGGKERIQHYLQDYLNETMEWEKINEMHEAKTVVYQNGVKEGRLVFRPGIEALIRSCHERGQKQGIVTTTSRGNVHSLIEANLGPDAHGWFDVIVTGEDAPLKKPDPGLYLVALERLGMQGGACLAVEDSANGLQSALACGIPTIITRTPWTEGDSYDGALKIFDNLEGVTLDDLRGLFKDAA